MTPKEREKVIEGDYWIAQQITFPGMEPLRLALAGLNIFDAAGSVGVNGVRPVIRRATGPVGRD